MWPDQQPPGGAPNPQQNPYQQPGYQQPNPYQQPGYQQYPQAGQYGQQSQWGQSQPPTVPVPTPPQGGGGRTKMIAIIAAAAVVVAAGVTGFLVLGKDGKKDDTAGKGGGQSQSPSAQPSSPSPSVTDDPRGVSNEKATIPGWKVVVNPKYGTAFDVPADWEVERPGVFSFFEDKKKNDGSAYIGFSAPSFLKPDYCSVDATGSGSKENYALAGSGTKGENGGKDTASIARGDAAAFVFGGYTDQSDAAKKYLRIGSAKPFTTTSGLKGSVASSYVTGVPKKNKCDTDGKAITFAFKNSADNFVSWTLYGEKGIKDELSDATIQKILATVRLHGAPTVE
ncbi:hypothetical protein [Streptomyces monashensis]|uniref:DUF8017 domain-containing protein n=1 Tax=Streptomyces monashensis TaxID=1678012 RepID=A0A1S2QLN5_9ACTN|nr:hypothetical protein [Streptomyces monashensis]OIK06521.1 hypothetical protein BIV23_07525 [Streptomyces monashensis]